MNTPRKAARSHTQAASLGWAMALDRTSDLAATASPLRTPWHGMTEFSPPRKANTMTDDKRTDDERRRALCDLTICRAAELMAEAGCPTQQILDRLLTFSAAQAATLDADGAAAAFRQIAAAIDAGTFSHLEARTKVKH